MRLLRFSAIILLNAALGAGVLAAPPPAEIVFFDLPEPLEPMSIPAPTADLAALPGYPNDPDQLTLAAELHAPDPAVHGAGPYPAVIVLHGSGGLWSFDLIANGLGSQFDDWAEVLVERGYLCLFVDSFNPRGIPGNFSSRRPHHDPAIDDALCSPNYERPKDVIAALAYLASRPDVDRDHIGLLGFSHGAQTGLNALMDPSVDKSPYSVNYIDADDDSVPLEVPDPVQIPDGLPFPKVFACYYPGCGHYGYHGQASSVVANRYMPDRRARVVMFHGTLDYLLDVDDPTVTPMTGNLFPIKFVDSSALHAAAKGVENPFVDHHLFDGADHSFDNHSIEPEGNWNTVAEDADEKAKRLARDETLKWFAFCLRPPDPVMERDPNEAALARLRWWGERRVGYHVESGDDLVAWPTISSQVEGGAGEMVFGFDPDGAQRAFFKVIQTALPAPVGEPENSGFFRDYGDFSY